MVDAPKSLEPAAAGEVLRRSLAKAPGGIKPVTVADASVTSGLALRDAQAGLHWLTGEYRGHLRVTEDGDLVHVFPTGFTKPWETRDRLARAWSAAGRGLLGAGRFIVRAWILVVMLGYTALFVALLIGLTFAGRSNDSRNDRGSFGLLGGMLRLLAEAFFWTFHPFSPFYYYDYGYGYGQGYGYGYGRPAVPARSSRRRKGKNDIPFYEKVNRFVFGPTPPPEDPNAVRARILAQVRAQKGRIGLADVMRVTGLPRTEADPLMARLMLDYDGTVEVGEQGGIIYRFESVRRTAEAVPGTATPPPAWETPRRLAPLTGNGVGSNVIISLLNGFNLVASGVVIGAGLTISNILLLFSKHPPRVLPYDGVPVALGVVPLVFSAALFALPTLRALFRRRAARGVARENARLAILREVLARAPHKEPVPDETLRAAYRVATGEDASSKEITRRVVELGGDVDVGPEGEVRYRFADLEAEAEALEEERATASDAEARLGKVVFASDA